MQITKFIQKWENKDWYMCFHGVLEDGTQVDIVKISKYLCEVLVVEDKLFYRPLWGNNHLRVSWKVEQEVLEN